MCIRYNGIDMRWERFIRRKKLWVPILIAPIPEQGLFPGGIGSLIRPNEERGRELVAAKWGLIPPFNSLPKNMPKAGYHNARMEGSEARGEGIENMPAFRDSFKHRRCVVPADCFFEQIGPFREKRWYRVRRTDEQPLLLAALWSPPNQWTDTQTYTIVTTAPPDGYIYDRIPVILEDGEDEAWASQDAPIAGLRALMSTRSADNLVVEDFEPVVYPTRKAPTAGPRPPKGQVETLF